MNKEVSKKKKYSVCYIIMLAYMMSLSGCTTFSSEPATLQAVKLELVNPNYKTQEETKVVVSKDDIRRALAGNSPVGSTRLIELVYRPDEAKPYPEYRIFGIQKDSIYEVLGLEDSDIIVAANGYILPNSRVFPSFLELLPKQENASIFIRREGKPILLAYEFF
jgi:type II secretory pathway component PulC